MEADASSFTRVSESFSWPVVVTWHHKPRQSSSTATPITIHLLEALRKEGSTLRCFQISGAAPKSSKQSAAFAGNQKNESREIGWSHTA